MRTADEAKNVHVKISIFLYRIYYVYPILKYCPYIITHSAPAHSKVTAYCLLPTDYLRPRVAPAHNAGMKKVVSYEL